MFKYPFLNHQCSLQKGRYSVTNRNPPEFQVSDANKASTVLWKCRKRGRLVLLSFPKHLKIKTELLHPLPGLYTKCHFLNNPEVENVCA